MASVIEICNIALSNIRAGSINSLTEGSLAAQQCNLKYADLRDQTLRDAPWSFARRIEALAVLSPDSYPVFNWAYAYNYPSDCLYINRLLLNLEEINQDNPSHISRRRDPALLNANFNRQVPYEIQNFNGEKIIAANESELRISYRLRVENPNLYDSQFRMALSHLLASELAVPLVGGEAGRKFRADSIQLYNGYINAAIAGNSNEQYTIRPDSEFITVRG